MILFTPRRNLVRAAEILGERLIQLTKHFKLFSSSNSPLTLCPYDSDHSTCWISMIIIIHAVT